MRKGKRCIEWTRNWKKRKGQKKGGYSRKEKERVENDTEERANGEEMGELGRMERMDWQVQEMIGREWYGME